MILGDKHGTCRLCLSRARPLCKSHVAPEFCYDYEYSGSGRRALAIHLPKKGVLHKRTIQKGHREHLFCADCEQILCKHEQVFAAFWKDNHQLAGPFTHRQLIVLEGLDYHHTKLFLLSVLWRASLSEILGKKIDLGPYSEKLRLIILNDEKVPQDAYPILGTLILDPKGYPFKGFVDNPICKRLGPARAYAMCFAGCEWKIFMSDHWVPKAFESMQHALSEKGDLYLVAMHYSTIPSTRRLAVSLREDKG
jgi:hypothetical protein